MTAEDKPKKKRSGEGWYLLIADESGTMVTGAGKFESLKDAEKELRETAEKYDGKTVLVVKIQRRMKVTVQTVKTVSFE